MKEQTWHITSQIIWNKLLIMCIFVYSIYKTCSLRPGSLNLLPVYEFTFSSLHIRWLVVLRINVDLAIFRPYLDLEAGDNQFWKFKWRGRESNPSPLAPQVKSLTSWPPLLPKKFAYSFLHSLGWYQLYKLSRAVWKTSYSMNNSRAQLDLQIRGCSRYPLRHGSDWQ